MRAFFGGGDCHLTLGTGQFSVGRPVVVGAVVGGGGHVLVGKRGGQRVTGSSPHSVVVVVAGGPDRWPAVPSERRSMQGEVGWNTVDDETVPGGGGQIGLVLGVHQQRT